MVTEIFQMPVSYLSSDAVNIIKRLNSKRLFFTEGPNKGLPRLARLDLRIATLVGLTTQDAENLCAMKVLEIWVQRDEDSKVHHLFHHLKTIDRHDLFDDLMELAAENRLIEETEKWTTEPTRPQNSGEDIRWRPLTVDDIIRGRPVIYDAMVLHADAEPEIEFANKLIEIMTNIGYTMFRTSALLSDVMQLTAMTELINSRCRHIISIFSLAFNQSADAEFLSRYVHDINVKKRSRQMILCKFENCEPPMEFQGYTTLELVKNTDFWWALAWSLNINRTTRLDIPTWVRAVQFTRANGHSSVTASAYTFHGPAADEAATRVANSQTDGGHRQRAVTNVANDCRRQPPNSNVAHLPPNGFVGNSQYASGSNGLVGNGFIVKHLVAGGFSENASVAVKSIAYKSVANESVAEESVVDDSIANDSKVHGQDANGTVAGNVNIQVVSEHSNSPLIQLSDLQSQRSDAHPTIKHTILPQ